MPYETPDPPAAQPERGAETDALLVELAEAEECKDALDVTDGEQPEISTKEAVANLRGLFETLVPRDTVEFVDAYGGEHTARALLPARRQVKVMRKLEALFEADVDLSILSNLGDDGGVDAAVRMLVDAAANEKVLSGLGEAFAAAHPGPVAAARKAAEEFEPGLSGDIDAADLFPIEEMVAGLVPFFVRLATRLLDAIGRVPEIDQSAQAS